MILTQAVSLPGECLSDDEILTTLYRGLEGNFRGQKVLVLMPDHTRSAPLPFLFRALVEILQDTRQLDFMVALGTHPPLSDESLNSLVGITREERYSIYKHIGLLNHAWGDPSTHIQIGIITRTEIQAVAGERWHPSLAGDVDVRINKAALEYEHILILGPTFPHEVVGFSGGAKYLFPGISGPEMINVTHWLGALAGVVDTIGVKETPTRTLIHIAARMLKTPVTLIGLVVVDQGLSGLFIGDTLSAWSGAADLSAKRHICWVDKPFHRVLSCAPAMYDELWTAAKAMYKLEPAIAVGGELVLYAPHLNTVSRTHGKYIYEIGYHILPYFLKDWERYRHIPLSVLAHSTHLKGSGQMEGGEEHPNVTVKLASQISPKDCDHLNLGYLNPANINMAEWQNHEAEDVMFVPKAGEILYRLRA